MPIEEVIIAGRVAVEVAEKLGPKAAEAGLNLLEVASTKTGIALPADLKAMVHVGPSNGRF